MIGEAGYVTPFAAIGAGAAVIASLLRKWGRHAAVPAPASARPLEVEATPDELARIEAAVRGDER